MSNPAIANEIAIHPAFNHIVGCMNIKRNMSLSLSAYAQGKPLASYLLEGEAGCGKTELGLAYADAIAEVLGVKKLFMRSPGEFRDLASPEWKKIVNWILGEDEGVLVIDEIHELPKTGGTKQLQLFARFLRKALDNTNKGQLMSFDGVNSFTFDKCKKVIIVMTNHAKRMDDAIRSRFESILIPLYSDGELEQIAGLMLAKEGMVSSTKGKEVDTVLRTIARATKGTARPISKIVNALSRYGKKLITIADAFQIMQATEIFPHGLNLEEIRALDLMTSQPCKKDVLESTYPTLGDNFRDSMAHMLVRGLCVKGAGGQYVTSEKGKDFLAFIKSKGFEW